MEELMKSLAQAQEQNLITPIEPDEETKNRFLSKMKKDAVCMFFGSIAAFAVALLIVLLMVFVIHIIVYSLKIVLIMLVVLCLPAYSVYNIFSTSGAIRKGDYSFYEAEVYEFSDKGYKVKGIGGDLELIRKKGEEKQVVGGDKVILARLKDELKLLAK